MSRHTQAAKNEGSNSDCVGSPLWPCHALCFVEQWLISDRKTPRECAGEKPVRVRRDSADQASRSSFFTCFFCRTPGYIFSPNRPPMIGWPGRARRVCTYSTFLLIFFSATNNNALSRATTGSHGCCEPCYLESFPSHLHTTSLCQKRGAFICAFAVGSSTC